MVDYIGIYFTCGNTFGHMLFVPLFLVICFVQNFFFGQHESWNIYFFCRAKRVILFPAFNIRLYDTNSESDFFFFPPPKSEYFFQRHWESEYFFKKNNHNPPPPPLQVKKLNGPSLKYVDIVNAKLIESTLKQTRMCRCFNDFLWLMKYKKCCEYLPPLLTLRSLFIVSRKILTISGTVVTLKSTLTSTFTTYDL